MTNTNLPSHDYWMKLALEEARKAMDYEEIPVASILVSNGKEIGRGQTQVRRRSSIAAHGELFALLEAKHLVFSCERPLVLYTTLEPCLMCLGAAMQTGVDEVVYGMDAGPDGGVRYVTAIKNGGQSAPKVTAHVGEQAQVQLMKEFVAMHPNSPAIPYVKAVLAAY